MSRGLGPSVLSLRTASAMHSFQMTTTMAMSALVMFHIQMAVLKKNFMALLALIHA